MNDKPVSILTLLGQAKILSFNSRKLTAEG